MEGCFSSIVNHNGVNTWILRLSATVEYQTDEFLLKCLTFRILKGLKLCSIILNQYCIYAKK